jgi:CheY-like chemotaxis protein
MTHDIFALKMLIVSESDSEREAIRHAASQGATPIDIVEVKKTGDAAASRAALAGGAFDVVLLDSRMPKPAREAVVEAARAATGRPLVILVGAAELKSREVLTDGIAVDGVLAKPIETQEALGLIENCVRARFASKVLIVDDSSTVRSVIRKVLQASRYRLEPEEAADGTAAIERARNERFDIVFLDCHMPGIDGFGTLMELKRAHPDAKVVMITGVRNPRIEERARADGASDFLYKPFFANDIDAVLNRLFGLMRPRWD